MFRHHDNKATSCFKGVSRSHTVARESARLEGATVAKMPGLDRRWRVRAAAEANNAVKVPPPVAHRQSLVVRAENSTGACRFPLRAGKEYLVCAAAFEDYLAVPFSSATQPAKAAASRIRQLRAMRDRTPLPALFGSVLTRPSEHREDLDEHGRSPGEDKIPFTSHSANKTNNLRHLPTTCHATLSARTRHYVNGNRQANPIREIQRP
jgi:hypothetical protein